MEYRTEDIRGLLELYFEGETTLEQERTLRDYFTAGHDVPADLEYAQTMFGVLGETARQAAAPVQAAVAAKPLRTIRPAKLAAWSAAVAAAIMLAVAVTVTLPRADAEETVYCYLNGEAVTDYDTALAYAQDVLDALSGPLGKTAQYLEPLNAVSRSLEMLGSLSEFSEVPVDGEEAPDEDESCPE